MFQPDGAGTTDKALYSSGGAAVQQPPAGAAAPTPAPSTPANQQARARDATPAALPPSTPGHACSCPSGWSCGAQRSTQGPAAVQQEAAEPAEAADAEAPLGERLPGAEWRERCGPMGIPADERRSSPIVELSLLLVRGRTNRRHSETMPLQSRRQGTGYFRFAQRPIAGQAASLILWR